MISAEKIIALLEPELSSFGVIYGLDSGLRDEKFSHGQEITIQVQPFKAHLLERFTIAQETSVCVTPLSLSIGLDGRPIFLAYDSEEGSTDRSVIICPNISKVVVNKNELVSVKFRVIEPVSRVVLTVIAKEHPATYLFRKIIHILDSEMATSIALQELWSQYKELVRHFEAIRADQRQTLPLDDAMLGLCSSPLYR